MMAIDRAANSATSDHAQSEEWILDVFAKRAGLVEVRLNGRVKRGPPKGAAASLDGAADEVLSHERVVYVYQPGE